MTNELDRSSETLAAFQRRDARHFLHPFTDFQALARTGTRLITHAEGVYIYEQSGHRLLDGMSGLWCCGLGYTQPRIVEAIHAQLEQLPFYNSFFQCTHPAAVALAERLTGIAPGDMPAVFFTNSGSEANDTVLRLIQRYWALMEQPERRFVIARRKAYHGSTIAAASLGGMEFMHVQFERLPYVEHITPPYWFEKGFEEGFEGGGELSPDEFGVRAARELESRIDALGAAKVAAFIAEPVQGAGGVIIPPDSYWPEIVRICRERDVLLVCDEVITGFGRTGKWFGSEYYGARPDLLTFAKAVTNGFQALGGVLVGERIASVLQAKGGEFAHGFTYSGHPAACAAALATLEIHTELRIAERVEADLAPYFQRRIRELADHPLVGEVRGIGALAALELVPAKPSRRRFEKVGTVGTRCRDLCVKNGLVMRAVGDTMILAPPLVLTHAGVDELIEKAWRSLDATRASLG